MKGTLKGKEGGRKRNRNDKEMRWNTRGIGDGTRVEEKVGVLDFKCPALSQNFTDLELAYI